MWWEMHTKCMNITIVRNAVQFKVESTIHPTRSPELAKKFFFRANTWSCPTSLVQYYRMQCFTCMLQDCECTPFSDYKSYSAWIDRWNVLFLRFMVSLSWNVAWITHFARSSQRINFLNTPPSLSIGYKANCWAHFPPFSIWQLVTSISAILATAWATVNFISKKNTKLEEK